MSGRSQVEERMKRSKHIDSSNSGGKMRPYGGQSLSGLFEQGDNHATNPRVLCVKSRTSGRRPKHLRGQRRRNQPRRPSPKHNQYHWLSRDSKAVKSARAAAEQRPVENRSPGRYLRERRGTRW
jgi:hypothetical protein